MQRITRSVSEICQQWERDTFNNTALSYKLSTMGIITLSTIHNCAPQTNKMSDLILNAKCQENRTY